MGVWELEGSPVGVFDGTCNAAQGAKEGLADGACENEGSLVVGLSMGDTEGMIGRCQ